MSEALPISAQILTWNSGKTLRRCLESVRGCAELLLIDGGSADGTLRIGREFGVTVVPQPAQGKPLKDFAAARNAGLHAAAQLWILALDSDEYLEPGCLEEIARQLDRHPEPAAFLVPRRYVLADGTVVRRASTYPNERLYLFHRDATEGWEKPVHERIRLRPGMPVHRLAHGSLAPLLTPEEFWRKNDRYIHIEVERMRGKGFAHWLRRSLLRAVRAQLVSMVRLLWIWVTPGGPALPLEQEALRWRYRWKLVQATGPWK